MKKTIISLMLILAITLASTPVQAASSETSSSTYDIATDLAAQKDSSTLTYEEICLIEAEIDRIIDEMNHIKMQQYFDEMSKTTENISRTTVETLNVDSWSQLASQLVALGAKELTPEELAEINIGDENGQIQPQGAYVPPEDTSNITWYMSGPYSGTLSNGNPFKYFYLRAQATGMNCDLVSNSNIPLITSSMSFSDFAYALGKIYVQKGIALIPVVQWTPYELLFDSSFNSNIQTASSYQVTALMTSTAKYVYMGPGGATLDDATTFNINFLTHSVSVAETHIHGYVTNGTSRQITRSRNYTVSCDNYASPLEAASEYYFYGFAAENPDPIKYYFNSVLANTVTPPAANANPYYVG